MRVSVEVSGTVLREMQHAAGECRKGHAIRNLAMEALVLRKRRMMTEKLVSGAWSVKLPAAIGRGKDRALRPR
jgi:hypothetical protein